MVLFSERILHREMSTFTTESIIISRILDRIGYGKDMRTVRAAAYTGIGTSITRKIIHFGTCIFSGSKAEGLSALFESDCDKMHIPTGIFCLEYPMQFGSGEDSTMFHLLKRDTAPGYALLKLSNICEAVPLTDLINDCLVELLPGQLFISSDGWKQWCKHICTLICFQPGDRGLRNVSDESHGPSVASSDFKMECDNVYAIACHCPSYLNSWITRERQYSWPTADIIEDVSELESHVVPVGYVNSPLQFLEWRICYTKGEIKLTRSLPDCLIKAYILMKAITKVTLKPLCKEMSSYIIKNIVLWIAELNPFECFSEKNLVTILQYAFKVLKQCLVQNNLPSYMISQRNLFADRLTVQQRSRLCMRIDCLVNEGPRMVLRVKKLREAVSMLFYTPVEFRLHFERRQIIETVMLMLSAYGIEKYYPNGGYLDVERIHRFVFTDDLYIRTCSYLAQLIHELEDIDDEENDSEYWTIDLDEDITMLRADPDIVRNNLFFKYLS